MKPSKHRSRQRTIALKASLLSRARLATAYTRSLIAWHGLQVPSLISASFAITDRCNLRCAYCNTPYLDTKDPSLEEIETVLDRLYRLGARRLGLTGGEPMVRKDLGEIVTLARSRGFYLTLNTNLTLYHRRPAVLDDVDLVFTSLDGDRAHHEASRGARSYDGVLGAIKELTAAGRSVVAICVITENSFSQPEALLELAEKHRFRIHFQPRCTDTSIVRGKVAASLTGERMRRRWSSLAQMKRAGAPIASSLPYLDTLAEHQDYSKTAWFDPEERCAASRAFLYVDPECQAHPCAYTRGQVEPVDLLGRRWRDAIGRTTPCTRCTVGPYLEFNLLYQQPVQTVRSVLKSYV